jgi:DNA repair exonuclease SbcCD ATPase subunit
MDSPPKSFAKSLLLTTRLQCLESNLNLEQLSRMNDLASEKYASMLTEVQEIEESYSNLLSEYELDNDLYEEIKSFKSTIDHVESSLNLLEEMTTRLETKLNHI